MELISIIVADLLLLHRSFQERYIFAIVQGAHCTNAPDGASPSGKAAAFEAAIRRFDPYRASQHCAVIPLAGYFYLGVVRIELDIGVVRTHKCKRLNLEKYSVIWYI
jgi:hypothetical protein